MAFKITFQNRVLLGGKVVEFESRSGIRTLGTRGHRCLSPEIGEDPGSSVGSVGGGGITSGVTGSGNCPRPRRRSPLPRLPSPGSGERSPGTRPGSPSPSRAAGARRRLPRPLNLSGDSDAREARNRPGSRGVPALSAPGAALSAPGSWAQRSSC